MKEYLGSSRKQRHLMLLWRILICLSVAVAASCASGCTGAQGTGALNARLDPEENGYLEEFKDLYQNLETENHPAYQVWNHLEDVGKYNRAQNQEKAAASMQLANQSLNQLKQMARVYRDRAIACLPPEAMASAHEKMIELLNACQNAKGPEDVAQTGLNWHNEFETVRKAMMTRPAGKGSNESAQMMNFQLEIPNPWDRSGRTAFRVDGRRAEVSFVVKLVPGMPAGTVGSPANAAPQGVQRIVIRGNGQERFFAVDRQFQVFVPTDYGVNVGIADRTYMNNVTIKTVTVDVRFRDQPAVVQPPAAPVVVQPPVVPKEELPIAKDPPKTKPTKPVDTPPEPTTGTVLVKTDTPASQQVTAYLELDNHKVADWPKIPADVTEVTLTTSPGQHTLVLRSKIQDQKQKKHKYYVSISYSVVVLPGKATVVSIKNTDVMTDPNGENAWGR